MTNHVKIPDNQPFVSKDVILNRHLESSPINGGARGGIYIGNAKNTFFTPNEGPYGTGRAEDVNRENVPILGN